VNESTRQYFSRLHALQLDVLHDSSERDFETVFADLAPIARRGARNPPRRTEAGKNHPQRDESARRAAVPRLPVESDRVRKVLSTILDSGALRIRDVTDVLRIPRESINALMQYLKRKHLVKKTGQEFSAPYALTDEGRAALAEMTRRHAA